MKRPFKFSLVFLLVIVALALGAESVGSRDFLWRSIIVARKLVGRAGDATWLDLWYIIRPHSGFELRPLAAKGNPYSGVNRPRATAADFLKGKQLFARNCARCHGDEGVGGIGPKLVGARLKHGEGDWAIYRTVMSGVDGTAMQGGLLARPDVWQVIAYLRELGAQGSAGANTSGQAAAAAQNITSEQLVGASADVGQWLLYSRSYDGQRFARDAQVNASNVSRLKVQWLHQFSAGDIPNEATPIVVGKSMFITVPPSTLVALDTETGKQLWQYTYPAPQQLRMIWLTTNRGATVLGHNVYWTTPDAHLLALDAAWGKLFWDKTIAEYTDGYSMTSPPIPVGDLLVTGVAGGDYPTRGFINAYDAASGELRWHFNTIPGPGEPGRDTWAGDSWKAGGAAAWGVASYDPELGLVYFGVGNPNPDYNAALRAGDNLYTNCELALDAKTGKLVWYFQFTPGDDHDWDSTQTPALIDLDGVAGTEKLLAVANRNGFFYVLDRRTGRFVRAVAITKQTWNSGLTPSGRPIRTANSGPTREGNLVYPSTTGATTWWPSAYSPLTQLYYTDVRERGGIYFKADPPPKPKGGGRQFLASTTTVLEDEPQTDLVRAIDPATATIRWEHTVPADRCAPRRIASDGRGIGFWLGWISDIRPGCA